MVLWLTVSDVALRSSATFAVFVLLFMLCKILLHLVWLILLSDVLCRHFDGWVLSY